MVYRVHIPSGLLGQVILTHDPLIVLGHKMSLLKVSSQYLLGGAPWSSCIGSVVVVVCFIGAGGCVRACVVAVDFQGFVCGDVVVVGLGFAVGAWLALVAGIVVRVVVGSEIIVVCGTTTVLGSTNNNI